MGCHSTATLCHATSEWGCGLGHFPFPVTLNVYGHNLHLVIHIYTYPYTHEYIRKREDARFGHISVRGDRSHDWHFIGVNLMSSPRVHWSQRHSGVVISKRRTDFALASGSGVKAKWWCSYINCCATSAAMAVKYVVLLLLLQSVSEHHQLLRVYSKEETAKLLAKCCLKSDLHCGVLSKLCFVAVWSIAKNGNWSFNIFTNHKSIVIILYSRFLRLSALFAA